jgi:hypothetical protein
LGPVFSGGIFSPENAATSGLSNGDGPRTPYIGGRSEKPFATLAADSS